MDDLGAGRAPIVDQVVRTIKDEFQDGLLGILWTGSRAYGEPRLNSDWDFFVLHQAMWRQRRLIRAGEAAIELFINPPDQIRREMAAFESATISMFAMGQVLYDRDGTTQDLVGAAQRLWRSRPPIWTREAQDAWRYEILDLLEDIEDMLADDPDAAGYLMGLAIDSALRGFYQAHQFWQPKGKYLLADLARRRPELALQCRTVISGTQALTTRFDALKKLVENIQRPMGGYLDTWETEREPVLPFEEETR